MSNDPKTTDAREPSRHAMGLIFIFTVEVAAAIRDARTKGCAPEPSDSAIEAILAASEAVQRTRGALQGYILDRHAAAGAAPDQAAAQALLQPVRQCALAAARNVHVLAPSPAHAAADKAACAALSAHVAALEDAANTAAGKRPAWRRVPRTQAIARQCGRLARRGPVGIFYPDGA